MEAKDLATTNEADKIDVQIIEHQQEWFSLTSIGVIVVSFVHMFMALALFSSAQEPGTWGFIVWFVERLAAAGMTLSVDVVTWRLAEYHHYAQRNRLARSPWVRRLFNVALGISMFLNGAYLWTHAPKTLNPIMSGIIATLFALFIPMTIGVFSLINGELEDDKHAILKRLAERLAEHSKPTTVPTPAAPQKPRPLPMKPRKPMLHLNDSAAAPATTPLEVIAPALATMQELDAETPQASDTIPASDLAYNAKLSTEDVAGILVKIREAGVSSFKSARELGQVCGWGSSASASRGLRTLIDAGLAVKDESSGMFVIVSDSAAA